MPHASHVQNPLARALLRGYTGLLIGLTALGVALVGLGAFLKAGISSTLLVALGSAVIGASASLLIGELHDEGIRKDIRQILISTLSPGVISNDSELGAFRHLWHHYFLTKVDGLYVWRYRAFDFRGSMAVGRLCAAITARDKYGHEHPFRVEAGFRENRFFLFCSSLEGIEPVSIEFYPLLGSHSQGLHCGFGIEQTWDGVHMVYPCLLSKTRLVKTNSSNETSSLATTEDVTPADVDILAAAWSSQLSGSVEILPQIFEKSD